MTIELLATPRKKNGVRSGIATTRPKTVAQVLDWFERTENGQPATRHRIEQRRLRGLFADSYGQMPLARCVAAHLLEFFGQFPKLSNHSKRRIKVAVNKPFNQAVQLGLIGRNPFAGLRVPMGRSGRDWTDEEYQAVLRNSPAAFRRFVIFLRFSGARPGEARKLLWSQINYEGGVIIQAEHKTVDKSDAPRRIFLNDVATKLLAWIRRNVKTFEDPRQRGRPGKFPLWRHSTGQWAKSICGKVYYFGKDRERALKQYVACKHSLNVAAAARATLAPACENIFVNDYGRPWSTAALTKRFRAILHRAGLPALKLHGLRHFFGTRAICNGVDVATLAQLLGHAHFSTTERYVHLAGKSDHLTAAAAAAVGIRQVVATKAMTSPPAAAVPVGGFNVAGW